MLVNSDLKQISEIQQEQSASIELEAYLKKLNNARRRIVLVNNILQNVQVNIVLVNNILQNVQVNIVLVNSILQNVQVNIKV